MWLDHDLNLSHSLYDIEAMSDQRMSAWASDIYQQRVRMVLTEGEKWQRLGKCEFVFIVILVGNVCNMADICYGIHHSQRFVTMKSLSHVSFFSFFFFLAFPSPSTTNELFPPLVMYLIIAFICRHDCSEEDTPDGWHHSGRAQHKHGITCQVDAPCFSTTAS